MSEWVVETDDDVRPGLVALRPRSDGAGEAAAPAPGAVVTVGAPGRAAVAGVASTRPAPATDAVRAAGAAGTVRVARELAAELGVGGGDTVTLDARPVGRADRVVLAPLDGAVDAGADPGEALRRRLNGLPVAPGRRVVAGGGIFRVAAVEAPDPGAGGAAVVGADTTVECRDRDRDRDCDCDCDCDCDRDPTDRPGAAPGTGGGPAAESGGESGAGGGAGATTAGGGAGGTAASGRAAAGDSRPAGAVPSPAAAAPDAWRPDLGLVDVGGAVSDVETVVRVPFEGGTPDPLGAVLVVGGPGAGKTTVLRRVAAETPAAVAWLDCGDLVAEAAAEDGDAMTSVDRLREAARDRPAVVVLDDFDRLGDRDVPRRLRAAVVGAVDDLRASDGTAVVAARRPVPDGRRDGTGAFGDDHFDRTIRLPAPDATERAALFAAALRAADAPVAPSVDPADAAAAARGFLPGDVVAAADTAALEAATDAAGTPGGEAGPPSAGGAGRAEGAERSGGAEAASGGGGGGVVGPAALAAAIDGVEPGADPVAAAARPTLEFDDVGGLADAKRVLSDQVVRPLAGGGGTGTDTDAAAGTDTDAAAGTGTGTDAAAVYDALGVGGGGGVLLHGPPGTGKTMLAEAAAGEAGASFFVVDGPEVMDKWVGEPERAIRETFAAARAQAPAVVVFDEVDAIAAERGRGTGGGAETAERVLSQILAELDGAGGSAAGALGAGGDAHGGGGSAGGDGVAVVATTNRPELIDEALLRPGRLGHAVEVGPPDRADRAAIFEAHLADRPTADAVDTDRLAAATPGFTGADVAQVCREAALEAARRAAAAGRGADEAALEPADFDAALDRVDATGAGPDAASGTPAAPVGAAGGPRGDPRHN